MDGGHWKSRLKKSLPYSDMTIAGVLTLAFYSLASYFDFHETLHAVAEGHEWMEMDELTLTSLFMICLLVIFSLRRNKELSTEIKRREEAEARSREERQNLEAIFSATPYSIVIIDMEKTILYANRAALDIMGYESLSQVVGRRCNDSFCPAEVDQCPILDLGHKMDRSEKLLISKDGTRVPILKSVVPFKFDGEDVLLEAFVDISEYKRSEAFLKDILESIDEAFVVVDRDFRILSANKAYRMQCKVNAGEVNGHPCYKASHGYHKPCSQEGEECPVEATFKSGQPHTTLHIHKDTNGENMYVEVKAYPLRDPNGNIEAAIELISDITDRLKLEEQLRHSQKMEAIGTLTGGVAHEFNNVITAILGFSEFLQDELAPETKLRKYADYITSSANRAARLTESLLAYSRKQITHSEAADLNKVLEAMGSFIRTLAGDKVKLDISLWHSPLIAIADPAQIEQVIINLSVNSIEAMQDGGTLSISSEHLKLDEAMVLRQSTVPPGEYALIRFVDTGSGIEENVMPKIFEPFFTTKDVGQGTGLGLAMVYGIVKKHNSFIDVDSQPGQGTTFSVYIPLGGQIEPTDQAVIIEEPRGGSETILLAEDDDAVRELMNHALMSAGYRVISARNGKEAVDAFNSNRDSINLLLFDLSMPEMDGMKAYEQIARTAPDIRVLFVSGYLSDHMRKGKINEKGSYRYLLKPVSPRELLRNVRSMLG